MFDKMFTLIDGGFTLYIEDLVDLDLSWKVMFISMVVLNILLTIRRINILVRGCQRASELKTIKTLEHKLAKA